MKLVYQHITAIVLVVFFTAVVHPDPAVEVSWMDVGTVVLNIDCDNIKTAVDNDTDSTCRSDGELVCQYCAIATNPATLSLSPTLFDIAVYLLADMSGLVRRPDLTPPKTSFL